MEDYVSCDQAWIAGFTWIIEGFIVRRHVLRMLEAVKIIQNATRKFLRLDVYIGQRLGCLLVRCVSRVQIAPKT